MNDYLKGMRAATCDLVDLGRELANVERILRDIRATGVGTETDALMAYTSLVQAMRRGTRAAESLRYSAEHE